MKIDRDLLLMLKSSELGAGEPDLGIKLMSAFLDSLYASGKLPARISCLNSGIFLTTEGSPVEDILRKFEEAGSEIVSCGTCLKYYDRADKLIIGEASNMKVTVNDMLNFEKILAP